ncbi:enoyl-CoA hydratase/isomerase family protein [Roseomonas sp. M0104]|uniref:Enoyl-CoA hydratase/isomerase family protein n=1 Tax=Teichococcus coralli TaxID=2545983 RepID=A0A845BEE0_9PROT|nr:enoyl-CoA hydratase/isomerase family protein [Pseudoroseomonas coralli]MXP65315.1 enoyl-CoA hydratase/isomerase family protein [Pseudoroseomonas coralli]
MIRAETRGRLRLLVLARPEKRNAIDTALAESLIAGLRAAEEDSGIAAIVLAAEGPGFCAGADLAEMRALAADPAARAARAALSEAILLAPGRTAKPVVAAVQGAALGAGAALALCCDQMLMAEGASLGFPEATHGMLPALMAPVLLRHLAPRKVFSLLASGRALPAAEVAALGLCPTPVPAAALLERAAALAEGLATLPPPAMLALKQLCAAGPQPLPEGFARARAAREALA